MSQDQHEFFKSDVPFIIAHKITNGHQLTNDLVNHVYIIMHNKSIDDYASFFARCGYQQWNWKMSEFNRQYKTGFIELKEELTPQTEQDHSETKYQKFLRDYLELEADDLIDWYKKEMAKLFIQGMTYREIQNRTNINLRYISETIKQFKYDVFNSYNGSGNINDTDDTSAS